jgi:hypothetical protein
LYVLSDFGEKCFGIFKVTSKKAAGLMRKNIFQNGGGGLNTQGSICSKETFYKSVISLIVLLL